MRIIEQLLLIIATVAQVRSAFAMFVSVIEINNRQFYCILICFLYYKNFCSFLVTNVSQPPLFGRDALASKLNRELRNQVLQFCCTQKRLDLWM